MRRSFVEGGILFLGLAKQSCCWTLIELHKLSQDDVDRDDTGSAILRNVVLAGMTRLLASFSGSSATPSRLSPGPEHVETQPS